MATLTESGRAALAASIKSQPIHLAWGTGDPAWESTSTVSKKFTNEKITLDHKNVKDLTLKQGEITFVANQDYTVENGTISRLQSGKILKDIDVSIHYTRATEPEAITAKSLLNEVGRRLADEVLFCIGDANGDLNTPTGNFKESKEPTNNLFLRFKFDFDDASTKIIKELGVMINTKTKSSLPKGKRYFEEKDIEDKGILLVIEHTVPLIRTPATRETFSFVVTF